MKPRRQRREAADQHCRAGNDPAVSADGTEIVFNSWRTGDAEVYTMRPA